MTVTRMLRSDAQENRDRLLDAACELFGERGLGVSMREVARRAGVGPATLYRRFPTRQDLLDAAFADEMAACRAIVEQAAADPDPWSGLRGAVERLVLLNARNQAFVEAFLGSRPGGDLLARHRRDLWRRLGELARRARASGSLRADFTMDDLLLVLAAGRAVSSVPAARRSAVASRFARLAVDALAADASARQDA
jgi:AcrR family transcriptional regulator